MQDKDYIFWEFVLPILTLLAIVYIFWWIYNGTRQVPAITKPDIALSPWKPGSNTGTPMTYPENTIKTCYQFINQNTCQ